MPTVNMLDAKTNLSRLVESVESGAESEIIIARNGKPAAKPVPIERKVDTSKRLGFFEGKLAPLSLEDFEADNDEIAAMFYGDKE
ncbi:MAG: type II toxin-antitoxin system Phd/YefM family antitoxin [Sphingomonadales bacterium]